VFVDVPGRAERFDRLLEAISTRIRLSVAPIISSIFATATCWSSSADISAAPSIAEAISLMYSPWYPSSGTSPPLARAAIETPKRSTCVPKSFE
jgi:hypothetical protein